MPALNFSKEFAAAVASGEKTQTIRGHRKDRPIKAGDTLYLLSGGRGRKGTKARRLGTVVCRVVANVTIGESQTVVANRILWPHEEKLFASDDGFDSLSNFRAFFRDHYGLPFRGQLIVWDKSGGER